ncbi:hypothetical protein BX661DRAFT_195989 [Kickxella alabastrina]|uniref:uncharacterized protein n=1 Tax=Kickxella alabastrina TaxID=61397 RepID=UPI00221E6562|nr:uncharacterized protein BX661DRAFT_195989 [Kickxella alabastrina]KAI7834247.1 hypothetical protein BX661DRAFT_195989 [Kickxella alabastrina]
MPDAGAQLTDTKLLQHFATLAQYQHTRERSSAALKQAFFVLAQARRSAGYSRISPDQYSGHAQPIATVNINAMEPDSSSITMTVARRNEDSSGVDPLLWFGMLVPPTLREAQSGFVDALDGLVALAQMKHELELQAEAITKLTQENSIKD